LILDDKSIIQCQSIIKRLAQTYQSVVFTPHITLSGTPDWAEEEIKTTIDEIVLDITPLELQTGSVRCSSNPYQKLTQGIRTTDQLGSLHQKVDTIFDGDYAKKTYPHISYLYSRLDCSNVSKSIESIEKEAPQNVLANQLALVRCKGTPEQWRMLNRWKLGN
jgi:hypothetical protein